MSSLRSAYGKQPQCIFFPLTLFFIFKADASESKRMSNLASLNACGLNLPYTCFGQRFVKPLTNCFDWAFMAFAHLDSSFFSLDRKETKDQGCLKITDSSKPRFAPQPNSTRQRRVSNMVASWSLRRKSLARTVSWIFKMPFPVSTSVVSPLSQMRIYQGL